MSTKTEEKLQNREQGPSDGVLAMMTPKAGDVKTVWNKDNPDEVAAAKTQFDNLKAKGFLSFRTDRNGEKGELIREFDANAESIIMSPPMKAG